MCPIYRDIYFVLPSASDILRYILSCRAIAIYDLPINLRYIYKRVSPLVDNEDEEEDDDANPEIGLDQIRCDVWLDYYGVVEPTPTAKIFKHEKYIDLNLI